MYELKNKLEWYFHVNLLGPGPRLIKKIIYRAVISQRLRNTVLEYVDNEVMKQININNRSNIPRFKTAKVNQAYSPFL
jgi:hypothetical protein